MAWALRQQRELGSVYISGSSASSIANGFSEATLAGSLLVAVCWGVGYVPGTTVCSVTPPQMTGWTLADEAWCDGSVNQTAATPAVYFISDAPVFSPSTTFQTTCTNTPSGYNTGADVTIYEFTGGPSSVAVNAQAVTNNGPTTATGPYTADLTISGSQNLIFMAAQFSGAGAGTGYTQGQSSGIGGVVQYMLNAAAGTISAAFNQGGGEIGGPWACVAICFGPAAAPPPVANGNVQERRYACNGIFDSSQKYGDVLRSLALSMAGWVVPPGPSWQIYAGAYIAPTISFGDADLRGSVKGDFRISARSVCNGVKGTFIPSWLPINPDGPTVNAPAAPNWRETDFPPYQDATAVAQDGGIPIWKDIKLDFTTSLWMAQRIAKIICEQLRRQMTISPQFKLYALQLVAGDVMEFTHARWGLEAQTYQVQSMVLTSDPGDDKVPALGVDQVLRQTDANVYVFNPPTSPTAYGDYSPYGSTGVGAGDVG